VARRATARLQQPIGEINLTPLIDLTFLLLITFVITFPLVQSGIPVNLPRGKKATDLPTKDRHTVSLDAKGTIYLDDLACSFDKFSSEMKTLGRTAPNTVILVRADETIPYGNLVKVLQVLHEAKLARMALVTQPENRKR
jgi:biopolymer transport protein TolR